LIALARALRSFGVERAQGDEDRGIVDQSAVRMRVATVSAGVWLS
jgi:hypothetical protein